MNSLLQNANSLRIGTNICLHIYNIRIIAGLKKIASLHNNSAAFFPSQQARHTFSTIYLYAFEDNSYPEKKHISMLWRVIN